MLDEKGSVIETDRDGWGVNERGYIQGGNDTPIFLKAKRLFNMERTIRLRREKLKKEIITTEEARQLMGFHFRSSDTFILATGHEPIIKEQNA